MPGGYPPGRYPSGPNSWPGPWWDEQCPARGYGLTHAHSSKCEEQHGFETHTSDQCCDCQMFVKGRSLHEELKAKAPTDTPRFGSTAPDHDFRWTISGRCGVEECNLVEDEHPLKHAKPIEGCIIAHTSITSRRLIGDDGMSWTKCPKCDRQIEPRFVGGSGASGPAYGVGRGDILERLRRRLEFIRFAKKGGIDDGAA